VSGLVLEYQNSLSATHDMINHRESNLEPLSSQLQLLPTELKAQSTLQIESDLIVSAMLNGIFAQLATAVTISLTRISHNADLEI